MLLVGQYFSNGDTFVKNGKKYRVEGLPPGYTVYPHAESVLDDDGAGARFCDYDDYVVEIEND